MGVERHERSGRADAWNVVTSKLRAPRLHENTVPRWRVIERLRVVDDATCIVVRAPAGYGKTTAVRQWAAMDGRPVAWVSLDRGDDDPVVLLRHIVRAFDLLEPIPEVEAVILGSTPTRVAAALPVLGSALERRASPFVLVLDDVHSVSAERAVDVLDRLMDLVPAGSQLVLVGRGAPALHLTRRLLSGQVVEIGQADLEFSEHEARAVLVTALPDLDELTVKRLLAQMEGWPAGLHLAALALQGHPDPEAVVDGLGASDRRLTEYFRDELLHHLSDADRTFLLRTSILERLTPDLCDAVLDIADSASVLDRFASSGNLFVVSLEETPPSFRYHHLFADLLVAELRRTTPHVEPELRRRAARWCSDHGDSEGATSQALATGDVTFAAEIVFRQLAATIRHGTVDSLERWLASFSASATQRDPLLALASGWLALIRGDLAAVWHWLGVLGDLRYNGPLPDGTSDLAVAVAAIRMTSGVGGVRVTAASAGTVREAGPDGSPWWGLAVLLEANAGWAAGEITDPIRAFADAAVAATSFPPARMVAQAYEALFRMRAGDEARGQALASRAAADLHEARLDDYALVGIVHCVRAYAAARRGAPVEARAAAGRAEQVLAGLGDIIPRGILTQRLVLADVALLLDDRCGARAHLEAVERLMVSEPDAVNFRAWADDLAGRLDGGPRPGDGPVTYGITAAEMRVLEQLTTHLSLDEIGQQLYVSRNTVKTHAIAIYRKLGVSGRSAAVDKARASGLLRT